MRHAEVRTNKQFPSHTQIPNYHPITTRLLTDRPTSTYRYVEAFPCDYDHGMSLSDGTCKCLRGYTGYDCSLACSPCVHGDCQMDGQCYCRPGWTLPDCSKKIWYVSFNHRTGT